MTRPIHAAVLLALLYAGSAEAACLGTLTSEQILGCLASKPRTRGIRMPTRGITVDGQAEPEDSTVDLMVNFEFNSARLSNDGMISLDALGKALTDPSLANQRFRIAGHTDAVGSDSFNQRLSEARAAAVRAYLAQNFRLDPAAFEVVGYGKSQLAIPQDPTAAANRRVQVTKLGG